MSAKLYFMADEAELTEFIDFVFLLDVVDAWHSSSHNRRALAREFLALIMIR